MTLHICPEGYTPLLDLRTTQQAIKTLKDCFQQQLGAALNLTRVSAPLFVRRSSGLNDDLSGVERKVAFDLKQEPGAEV
ncbi:MAG: aspartate--ammonia ligase, partial [Clostridia bacterium]